MRKTLEIEEPLQAVDVRIGLANLLQRERPGNSAKIANVKVVNAKATNTDGSSLDTRELQEVGSRCEGRHCYTDSGQSR